MMQQQEEDKQAVEDKQVETQAKLDEITEAQSALEVKAGDLNDKQLDLNILKADLESQQATEEGKKQEAEQKKADAEAEKAAQEEAARLAEERRQAEEAAAAQAAAEAAAQAQEEANNSSASTGSSNNGGSNNNSSNNGNSNNNTGNNNGGGTTVDPTPSIPSGSVNASAIIATAERYLGVPYLWGGTTPSGFDCSGLVQYVYAQNGISLPRVTTSQEYAGTVIPVSQAKAGDLYFFGSRGSTHHVAIATGGGNYIHAPQTGDVVKYSTVSWYTPSFAVRLN